MLKTKLKNTFLRNGTEENCKHYRNKRKCHFILLRRNKMKNYGNLNVINTKDKNRFLKVFKPMFSIKIKSNKKQSWTEEK